MDDADAALVMVSPLPTFTLEIPVGVTVFFELLQKASRKQSGRAKIVFFILNVFVGAHYNYAKENIEQQLFKSFNSQMSCSNGMFFRLCTSNIVMEKDQKKTSKEASEKKQEHFPEKKEIDSNKAGSPDKNKEMKTARESAKNSQ